jgi:hypothetical protein
LEDITSAGVAKTHARIAESSGTVEANRAIEIVRAAFNQAIKWKLYAGDNPTANVQRFEEKPRERFLSPEEMGAVNQALLDEPDWGWRATFRFASCLGLVKANC